MEPTTTPGVCVACRQRMLSITACTDDGYPYLIDGEIQWLSTIPYGDDREGWADLNLDPPARCHDCAVTIGNSHHWGCDVATCPHCDEQLLGCDCEMAEPGDPRLERDE